MASDTDTDPEIAVDNLQLRCRPRQARSLATFELILDTAATLLDQHGMAGFTTNLLAEASGVSVRAIYRYFPNKQAVLAELAQRMESRWRGAVDAVDGEMPEHWPESWTHYLDAFVAAVRSTVGARAVIAAMRDDPELRAIDDIANRRYTEAIAASLRAQQPSITPERAAAVATVLMRSTVVVLDDAFVADDQAAAELVSVLKTMHTALLDTLLTGGRP